MDRWGPSHHRLSDTKSGRNFISKCASMIIAEMRKNHGKQCTGSYILCLKCQSCILLKLNWPKRKKKKKKKHMIIPKLKRDEKMQSYQGRKKLRYFCWAVLITSASAFQQGKFNSLFKDPNKCHLLWEAFRDFSR